MRKDRAAVKADAGDAADREFDNHHIARFSTGGIAWGAMDRADMAVGKGCRIEIGGLFCFLSYQMHIVFLDISFFLLWDNLGQPALALPVP